MSRSDRVNTRCKGITPTACVLAVLTILMTATGCDGGIFGTGDGADGAGAIATDMAAPDSNVIDPVSESQGNEEEDELDEEGVAPSSPADTANGNIPGLILSFSNTLPSGLDSQTAPLPALKVINLTEDVVNAAALNTPATDVGVDAQPGTTSELLTINIGETDISLATVDDAARLATISPLNSAEDSLTTIVVSGSIDNPDSDAAANGVGSFSVLALETRAAVSASGMAEVRLILTSALSPNDSETDSTSSLPTQYLLTPDNTNTSGVELVFTTSDDGSAFIGSYQLITPGDFLFSSNGDMPLSQPITFEANTVYTLIVTAEMQNQVFVEIDSLVFNVD